MSPFRVLLVDDEEEFVATLAERLELRGINTMVAGNGEEALASVKNDPPEVVVMDLMLPGMSGIEIMGEIKRNHPRIPVILLTGRGSTKEGIEGMNQGAFDFLMKPVRIEELITKMKNAVGATQLEEQA
jgi:DNA-binding response OmpR family regulator